MFSPNLLGGPVYRSRVGGVALACVFSAVLVACGGGDDDTPSGPPNNAASYSVGGTVAGLTAGSAQKLTLQDSTGGTVTMDGNGTFALPNHVQKGKGYSVSIANQPTGQACSISNASGVVSGNVANVAVSCSRVRYAYVTDSDNGKILQFASGADGALMAMSVPPVAAAPNVTAIAAAPGGKSVYAVGDDSSTSYAVGSNGSLTSLVTFSNNSGLKPTGVAIDSAGAHVYITDSQRKLISGYKVGAYGVLDTTSAVSAGTAVGLNSVTVDPAGENVYAAQDDGRIARFKTSAGSGSWTLSESGGALVGGGTPQSVVIVPSGAFAYVPSSDGKIYAFKIGSGGDLTPSGVTQVASGPTTYLRAAEDVSGKYIYVTDGIDRNILQYAVGADGNLTAVSAIGVDIKSPISIKADPAGQYIYVAGPFGEIGQYRVSSDSKPELVWSAKDFGGVSFSDIAVTLAPLQ